MSVPAHMVMAVSSPVCRPDVLRAPAVAALSHVTPSRHSPCAVHTSLARHSGSSAWPTNPPLLVERSSRTKKKDARLRHGSRLLVSAGEGGTANTSERTLSSDHDGVSASDRGYQNADEVESLRLALAAAEQRASILENAQKDAIQAAAAAEAKAQQFSATITETREKAIAEIEAAKAAFNSDLEAVLREKVALESDLKTAKTEAIELALKVERIAERAVREASSQSAEDAQLKLAAAETIAADASYQLEEKIRRAADEAAKSVVGEAKEAIREATEASEKAKEHARKAEAALVERLAVFDNLANAEATAASLQEARLDLERKLILKTDETERLTIQLRAVEARAVSAESRLAAAEAALEEVNKAADRAAAEREQSTKRALEALKVAADARDEIAKATFKVEIEALEAAAHVARKADKLQEQALQRRCQALQKSLKAAEDLVGAWKARALAIEGLFKEAGLDNLDLIPGVADVLTAGRLDTSIGNDSKKWELLANGPRRETPEWMRRRIESGLQGLPPRETLPIDGFVESDIPLALPTPEEVWSIANAKVKPDDLFAKQAAEKEALDSQRKKLDSQRKALERALQKKGPRRKSPEDADIKQEPGTGSGREIVVQGFNWESWRRKWYLELAPRAADLAQSGITAIWLPPPTESVSPQGYMPSDLYNLNSAYGTKDELKTCIEEMHNHDILVLGDVVLNHRCAQKQNTDGIWNIFGGKLSWGPEAIVRDDPNFRGQGNPSTGDFFHAAPNIDHSQPFVRKDIKEWMKWLRTEIGYDGWRLDFVRGFWGGYVKEYIEATEPVFSIGEYWDSLSYEGGNVCYNQDPHRQRIINWINATGGSSSAFDVTTKGILHSALHGEYWRLIDPQGKPPGVVGWWPSRAVTFLENHDTGSTQGHWPFPRDKLMQGYAYILTHPGTPVVFYDHFYDFGLHDPIAELIAARTRTGVHCRSPLKILHANHDGYVAQVGENLVMKLGRLDWNPSKQDNLVGSWERFIDKGGEYQLWERT